MGVISLGRLKVPSEKIVIDHPRTYTASKGETNQYRDPSVHTVIQSFCYFYIRIDR